MASSRRLTALRGPSGASKDGSSSAASSLWPSTLGRRESGEGADSLIEGSWAMSPRFVHHWKNERREAAVLAMEALEYRLVAMKARYRRRTILSTC